MLERITRLDQVIEINGNGDIRKTLAFYVLAFEKLRQEAAQQNVHPTGLESGGFCEKHDVVFYGESCPLCTASG